MLTSQTLVLLLGELGESDCEEIGSGFLRQPTNTITSGAYTVFGLWMVIRALRNRTDEVAMEVAFGLALAGVGLGSIAFHGPAWPGSRFFHDVTIAVVFAIIVARNLAALFSWPHRWAIAVLIIAVVGGVMAFAPDAGNVLTGVVGAAAVVTEVILYRTGRRRVSSRVAWFLAAAVVLLVGAAVINVLGRTGGPICDADSIFQGHGLWHVLTAAAFMVYGYAAFPSKDEDTDSSSVTF